MVEVTLYKKNDLIVAYNSFGHTGEGNEIVCAAVSMLDYAVANTINSKFNIETKVLINDGEFKLEFVNEENAIKVQDVLMVYEVGIQNLVEEYPEFVSVSIKED